MAVKLLAIKGYALVFLYMETGYNRAAKQTNLAYRNVLAGFVDSGKALPSLLKHGMTKMKTSNIQKHFRPTILAAAIFGISFTAQAVTVPISNKPLTGVTIAHGPNITLTPSVEHPTAGAAYSNNEFMYENYPTLRIGTNQAQWQNQWKRYYLGYFDNTKCYVFKNYGSNNGYFEVSSQATTDAAGNVGLCSGTADEYSGNFLNWATMSAIDIFRYSLTGGNRARGVGNAPSNYTAGDTTDSAPAADRGTFLRRAYVNPRSQQNGSQTFRLRLRAIDIGTAPTVSDFMFLKRIIPSSMVDSFATTSDVPGLPRALGFRYYASPIPGKASLNEGLVAASEKIGRPSKIFFVNESFYVTPVRMNRDGALMYQDRSQINPRIAPGATQPIVQTAYNASQGKANLTNAWLPVVVKACDPGTLGTSSLASNCRQYGSLYKPEGLMQKYGRGEGPDSRPARFAVFSYQLNYTNDVSGGVLRTRMKYLDRTQRENGITYGQEWDERTGVLAVNPDDDDARKTNVSNSGAINYINKFGDAGNYKGLDTSAELFYTAQRYLRNKGMPVYYEQTQRKYGINPTTADGFPMIYDWDDPLTRGLASRDEAQCRSNTMILIGDTFTHDEKDLPNFSPNSGVKDDPEIQTEKLLRDILDQEKFKGLDGDSWDKSRGSYAGRPVKEGTDYSPAGLVALAYWGRTHDIRQDIPGDQYINTFTIDVLETGFGRFEKDNPASLGNTYYWAAKYGGFDYKPGITMPNQSRESWTADTLGVSSSPVLFPDGMPKNFALGNSPENMTKALEDAFQKANEYSDPSQAFVGVTEHHNSVVDVDANKTLGLQSSYNVDKLSGDVIAQRIGSQGNGLSFTPAWRASTKMEAFHTVSGWSARKLFTEAPNGTITAFTPGNVEQFRTALNAGASAASLVQYTLGDPSLEGTAWRKRENGLLGTIINSGVQPILPPHNKPAGCNYADSNIMVRKNFYVTASNAGVLHVLNQDGQEVMGYIPSTALPKLYSLSLPVPSHSQPVHQYLNDGTPVTDEVCFGNTAKSIVVGTAGRGGASVYALDVTDLSNPGAHNVMWEFSNADDPDLDLGLTVGKPSIAKDKDGNPIVIFSSGVNSGSSNGYLYILRADNTGNWQLNTNYWKVPLGQDGVGEPAIYDRDGDKMPEAVFVGDLSGKMWRVDYNKTNGLWEKAYGNQPLYTPSGTGAPITAAPVITQTGGHLYVVAGTGQYFSLADISPSVQNYALGFFAEQGPITDADLLGQSFIDNGKEVDAIYSSNTTLTQKIYQVSQNAIKTHHKGWRLTLLKGQAIVSQPAIRRNKVATFTAVRTTPTGNVCSVNGATALIAVSLQNGGQYNLPAFDTNKDGRFDGNDTLGGMLEVGGIIAPVGTSREATVNGNTSIQNILAGDTGTFAAPMNTFDDSLIRRISWREIF